MSWVKKSCIGILILGCLLSLFFAFSSWTAVKAEEENYVFQGGEYDDTSLIDDGAITQTAASLDMWLANGAVLQKFTAVSNKVKGIAINISGTISLSFAIVEATGDPAVLGAFDSLDKVEGSCNATAITTVSGWNYITFKTPVATERGAVYYLAVLGNDGSWKSTFKSNPSGEQATGTNVSSVGEMYQYNQGTGWSLFGEGNQVGAFKIYGEAVELNYEQQPSDYNDESLVNGGSITQVSTNLDTWLANGAVLQEFIAASDTINGISFYVDAASLSLSFQIVSAQGGTDGLGDYASLQALEGSSSEVPVSSLVGWNTFTYKTPVQVEEGSKYYLAVLGNGGSWKSTFFSHPDLADVEGVNTGFIGGMYQYSGGNWTLYGEGNQVGAFKIYGKEKSTNLVKIDDDSSLMNEDTVAQTAVNEGDAIWFKVENAIQPFVATNDEITGVAINMHKSDAVNIAIIKMKGEDYTKWGELSDPNSYDVVYNSASSGRFSLDEGWNYVKFITPVSVQEGEVYYLMVQGYGDTGWLVAYIESWGTSVTTVKGMHLDKIQFLYACNVSTGVWALKDSNLAASFKVYFTDSYKDAQTGTDHEIASIDADGVMQSFVSKASVLEGVDVFLKAKSDVGTEANIVASVLEKGTDQAIYTETVSVSALSAEGEWVSIPIDSTLSFDSEKVYYLKLTYTGSGEIVWMGMNEAEAGAYYMECVDGSGTAVSGVTAYEVVYKKYTIVFKDHDGTVLSEQEVVAGKSAIPPEAEREGYSFVGWDSNAYQDVAADAVITAQYEINTYRVQFITNGANEIINRQSVKYGEKVEQPKSITKDGYVFAGWFTDEACTNEYDFDSAVSCDFTLYAKWEEESQGGCSGSVGWAAAVSALAGLTLAGASVLLIRKRKES